MDDSWQKLMGIDCGSEGPSSPVFHKKKWVVLPTSLKRSGSGPLLTRCPEKKMKNKMKNDSNSSRQNLDLNSTMPPEDKALKNPSIDEDDSLLIYNTTPTKNYKQKRKTIDLLNYSFRSEGSFCKKSKLDDKECAGLSKDPSCIKLEKKLNELAPETLTPTSIKVSSPQSNKSNLSQKSITSKSQRKLLYSCNEKINSNLKAQTLTVNDIFKSVIMIDEADIHSSPKKNRQMGFEVESNDFQSVTSLSSRNLKDFPKGGKDLVLPPSISALENCNDSFVNCMFTEIENECITTKEVCLKSSYKNGPMTTDSPASPVGTNPMDETFSNYRFTEIEEDCSRFNHKESKDNDPMASIKSDVIETGSSLPGPQNSVGRNTCSTAENKNDCPGNGVISHNSGVLNKIVKAKSYHSSDNERDQVLLQENCSEDSYLKFCGDEKDIFNSTISPQKSISKLETSLDKDIFLSTSKDCFDNLDTISTEEFRNNHLENNPRELNESLKEDVLNQSIDNPEKDLLNKSVSKLDITLTDIMQRLLKKRVYNEPKPNLKNQSLDKRITSNGDSSLDGLTPEISAEEETLGIISSSECIPEPLDPSETVFLTQEYLENVKTESSVDTSVVYYQQSFDYMISAEVKSRLSDNNCVLPPVEQKPLLLDRSLSSEVCLMADSDVRSPGDSFININYKQTDFNESNTSNLNESVTVIENMVKSPTNSDYFNNGTQNQFSQYEHVSHNSVANCLPKALSSIKYLKQSNNVEIHSNKVHSNINKFPNQTSCMTGVSSLNSDLISQGCLQQFNYSFPLELDDLVSQKKEKNLDNIITEEINRSNVNSHHCTSLTNNSQSINISEECLTKHKSKYEAFLDETTLITHSDDAMRDGVCNEDSVLEQKNYVEAVNLKNVLSEDKYINTNEYNVGNTKCPSDKYINTNEYNVDNTKCPSEIKNVNLIQPPHSLHLGMKNSIHGNVNIDALETVQSDHPVLFQKPFSPIAHQKSDANYSLTTALGKSISVSEESLRKIRSIFTDDLVVTDQDNFRQCLTDSDFTSLNVHSEKFNSDKKNQTESPLSFNTVDTNIDVPKSLLSDVMKTEQKTDIDQTFKLPLPRPNKVDNFMFSSAGGKTIEVSENALAEVKSIFNDILESDSSENKDAEDNTSIHQAYKKSLPPRSSKAGNFIFSSASERTIQVSEDALATVKSKFNEISENNLLDYKNTEDKTDINQEPMPSSSKVDNFRFSTAGGKNVNVSDIAFGKVKSKFNEIFENSLIEVESPEADQAPKTSMSGPSKNYNFMFSTAGGKNIKVSDVALAKVKSKFNEIMESHETEVMKVKSETSIDKAPKTVLSSSSKAGNSMFSSACGKNVKVSENEIAEVKSKFNEISKSLATEDKTGFTKDKTDSTQAYKISLLSSNKNDNFMFSTAGGKNIKITDAALAKVKSKFNEIMESHETEASKDRSEADIDKVPKTFLPSTSKGGDFMFLCASGNNFKALEVPSVLVESKSNKIFENHLTADKNTEDKTDINLDPKISLPKPNQPVNFKVPHDIGKNNKDSEYALAQVKSNLNEIFESRSTEIKSTKTETDINHPYKTSLPVPCKSDSFMFSTAGGKNVKVSDLALAKVKSKFSEILESHEIEVMKDKAQTDQVTKTSLPISSKNDNFMFLSASGKNIEVSQDALAKVKSKFSEIFESSLSEVISTETETRINQSPKISFPSSSKNHNLLFSSAGGKHINVSDIALSKVKSKFIECFENSSTEVNITEDKKYITQTTKTSLPTSSKNDNFMFSTGKNIKVSDVALANVKSKFNEILESHETEIMKDTAEINTDQASKAFLPNSSQNDNFMFSTADGKNMKVFDVALAKVKSKFNEMSENNSAKGGYNEIEINECQLLETSFSCFDKSDPFCISFDESKNIEISDACLDEMKFNLNGTSKDNSTEVELNKSRNVLHETSKNPLTVTNKKDNSFPFSADISSNVNVGDKLLRRIKLESFPSIPNINEIECEKTPDRYLGIQFSSATGKHISVSKDALLKVRSKFSEVIDSTAMHLLEAKKCNDNVFQHHNSPNKNLSDDVCLDPVSEKQKLIETEDSLGQIPIPNNETPTNSPNFTKSNLDKKLSISLNQNDNKKSKFSHSRNTTADQPLAKKLCFQPGIVNLTSKLSSDANEHNFPRESKIPYLTFTQSISQSLLDKEMDIIEKKKSPRESLNLNDNDLNSKLDESLKSKDLEYNKCDNQFSTEESDLTMIYEVSNSTAAFMADCTPDRSVLSSPSSFFSRKSMKPIKLLEMEFDDVDDEIMVAAELKIIPGPNIKNPVTNESTNDSVDSINFRCSVEILSIRADQRKRTDDMINKKMKNRPLPSPGFYMTLRNGSSLKRINDDLQPFLDKEQLFQLGLKEELLCINSTNAGTYEFCAMSFFNYEECFSTEGIINLGYGFSLILSDDNKIGFSELSRCFLSNPNVDPSLVSSDWIKNHFKWIVWKLACYERAFPNHLAKRYLSPENVLHQLKYRYDREIDLAQRPALKKILECDEPSSRRLIACVADIRNVDSSDDESTYEIELTDGWYSIWACIDPAMKNLIDQQKVKIGMKLIIQAAELLNCTEGCDPLQISSSIRLKLHTNCVRRVKWDSKMGFTRNPGPIRVSLSSVLKNGGLIGLTSAIIARVYPLLFMSKDADGKTVLRNAYAEHHASSLKENDLSLKSEELFEKLFPEIEAKYKSGVVKFDKNNITKIKDPEFLWKIVSNESDPSEVQSLMTPDQLLQVRKYHELMSSKIREEVQALVKKKLEELIPSQKAKCLLKMRLVDPIGGCNALLTVWNPSENLLQILVEKKCFDFYALNASGIRDKVLQLSNTNRTIYKESNLLKPSEEFERKVTTIYDIVVNSVSAQFGEMDVIGTVIFVKEPEKPWGVTNVYLSDSQESFLMITFWTSLKTLGCDDALKPGSTVACINLQWRQGSGSYIIPSTYANEMTYFSTNPKQEYLIKSFQEIKSSITTKGLENFIIERRRRLFTVLKEKEYYSKTPVSRVETPKVLKRLENLKKYGDASPLPKLSLLSSPDIHRKFRSPKSGGS